MDSWLSYLQKAKSNTLRTVVLNFHDCNCLDNFCRGDLDHLQHMPHTQNNKLAKKLPPCSPSMLLMAQKIIIKVKGCKNFKKDSRITTKDVPHSRVHRVYYIKVIKFYLSHTYHKHTQNEQIFFLNLQPLF